MRKLLLETALILVFSLFSLATFLVKPSFADTNFDTHVNVNYKVNENGITSVTNTFTLKNKTSTLQAEKYIFSLKSIEPTNIKAYEKETKLKEPRKKTKIFQPTTFNSKFPKFWGTKLIFFRLRNL